MAVRNTLTTLLLTWGLAACLHVHAQPSYRFEHLQVPGGRNENFVTSIVQDSLGFMWFGTWGGLHRYDGYAFTTYAHEPTDSTSLSANWVECLYVDREGTLWVGTYGGGLNRFNPETETFTRYRHDPNDSTSLSQDSVTVLLADHRGQLWVGTHGGLNRFDRGTGTFTRYLHDPGDSTSLSNDQVRTLYEDNQGTLWVGTNSPFPGERDSPGPGGLNRFDREAETFTRYLHDPGDPKSLISNYVMSLYEDARGTFWVGTMGNVLHAMDREAGTFERFVYDPSAPGTLHPPTRTSLPSSCTAVHCGGITFIDEDRSGTLWIGAFGEGLLRYDPETRALTPFEHEPDDPSSLYDNFVWTMVESRDGTRWLGETVGGVEKMRPAQDLLEHYTLHPTVGANWVAALHAGPSGRLWVGVLGSLATFARRGGGASSYHAVSARAYPEVTIAAIEEARDGTLWIGTYEGTSATRHGGLYRLDRETGALMPVLTDSTRSGARIGPIVALHDDSDGDLWLGTRWTGLFRMDRETETLTHYAHDPDDSTSRTSVTTIYDTPSEPGVLWIGTEGGGLNRFDREAETFTRYRHDPGDPTSLSGGYVTSLYEDARGRLWIGTRRGGLNQFDREAETFLRLNQYNSGLPDNHVACMLGDGDGHLWMGTSQGLTHFDPEAEFFYTYEPEHGVKAAPFVAGACARGHAGELVFGGINGFVAFDPEEVHAGRSGPPPVVVTDFLLARQPVGPDPKGPLRAPLWKAEEIELAHNEHTFSFEFAALDYRDPEANQYAYRLEGYDETWREAGTQQRASYHRVPPGEYIFQVRAANSDGVWNKDGASIRVTVLPPWWRTWWAYGLYVVIFAAGVFAVDRIQRRRLIERERKRAEIREAEIRAETAEVQARIAEEHAQKLEELDAAKSRFVANISHEFRTPLTLLLGPIQDALSDRTEGLSRPQLAAMHRNAKRLLGLINQLLDLARVETGSMQLHRQPVDLVALLRNITIAFSAQADREGIALSFHTEVDRVPAFIDPDKVEKVIFNLLSNAFKFTPSGQKVRIRLRTVEGPSGMQAEIVVKDTGQGIPPEKLDHIFDRFFQGGNASSGEHASTGIGLALAKEFVELHGGQIEAESEPGFGTTFTVWVPLEQDRLPSEEVTLRPSEEHVEMTPSDEGSTEANGRTVADEAEPVSDSDLETPTGACVLIVEDNSDVRSYVRGLLTPRYRVVEARDGDEGLEAAQTHQPDLVIADVIMPRRSGVDLCRHLKADEELRHIPVVLLTARADQESRRKGLETGADAYVSKPFDAEELLLRVENLIELRCQLRTRYSDTVVVRPTEVEVTSRDAAFLERVREVVEEHLEDPSFGVERLAQEVNLSTRQLQRRLRDTADLSAAAFIRKMRLERAAQLLEQDAGLVSQIAYRVGYQNADAFSRVFRQVYGVPPSEYPD